MLPLVKKYGAAVIAISNDETGISEDPDVRYAVAKKIVERAMDHGIPACDVVVDPLVMPIGAINQAGVQVMRLVHRLRTELKVNTSCGASNISFGLPNRDGINSAFLTMAMGGGHDLGHHQSACTSRSSRPAWARTSCWATTRTARAGFGAFATRPPPGAGVAAAAAAGGKRRAAAAKAAIAGVRRSRTAIRMASRDPLVVFTPSGKRGNFPVGTPLLQAARSLGVDIDSVCGGRGLCGRCQVLVAEGEFAKHGVSSSSASLSPFSEPEKRFSRRVPLADGRRLSCSARVEADVVIDVPASSQVHRQVVRKEADEHAIELNPVVRLHYVQVKQPDMHDPSGDLRRLFEALESEWSLTDLTCDLSVLQIPAADVARRRLAGHGRGARGEADHRSLARAARTRVRARGRHRFDDDRRASVRFEQRRGRGLRRRHESADPLRRRFDEPRLVFDDESRRGGADDGGGARGAVRTRGGRGAPGGHFA